MSPASVDGNDDVNEAASSESAGHSRLVNVQWAVFLSTVSREIITYVKRFSVYRCTGQIYSLNFLIT